MKNSRIIRRNLLSLIGVFIMVLTMLAVMGVAWARFSEEDKKIMRIETYHDRQWYIYGGDYSAGDADEILPETVIANEVLPGVIEWNDNERRIRFHVTNGKKADSYGKEDFSYSIWVLVTNTLKPTDLTLMLQYYEGDTVKSITAEPERITEDSQLYKSIGDGWIYKFYVDATVTDTTQNNTQTQTEVTEGTGDTGTGDTAQGTTTPARAEFVDTLKGGQLSMNTYDLSIIGQAEAGLLEIEIIEYTQE